jgi:hypothetical protein
MRLWSNEVPFEEYTAHFLTRFAFAPLQFASWQLDLCGGCLTAGGQRGGRGRSFGRQPAGVGPADQRAAPADNPAACAGGGQRSAAHFTFHTLKSCLHRCLLYATKNKDTSTCRKAVETSFRFPSQDLDRGDLGYCSLQEALPKGKMGQLVLLLKGCQAAVVVLQVANPAA